MTQRERQLLRWIEEDPTISQQELAERAGITRSSVAVHISNLMKKGYIIGKGYIVRSAPYIAVIGAVSMDITGRSHGALFEKNTNPGQVRTSIGGTGLHIAHALRLLGSDVQLITALGNDVAAQRLMDTCGALGISLTHALHIPGASTPTCLSIAEPDGSIRLAVSDTAIYEQLTPAFLSAHLPMLNHAQLILIDTSLPEESMDWLAKNCHVHLLAAPICAAQAHKLRCALPALHALIADRTEIEQISGIPLSSRHNLERAADVLLSNGVKRLYISLDENGLFIADRHERRILPRSCAVSVNAAGSAEAFAAAIAWLHPQSMDLEYAARAGMAAAAITSESEEVISPALCAALLHHRIAAGKANFTYPHN